MALIGSHVSLVGWELVQDGVTRPGPVARILQHRGWLILLGVALGLSLLSLCFGHVVIWPGTEVAGIPVGGRTPSSAASELRRILSWESRKVTLECQGFSREVFLSWDLGVTPNVEKTIRTCKRTLWSHLGQRQMPILCEVSSDKVSSLASQLALTLNTPVVDASFRITEDEQVEIVPHQVGRSLDVGLFHAYVNSMAEMTRIPDTIEIPFLEENPKVLSGDLEAFLPMTPVAQYSTSYQDGNDRAYNIGLASRAVSNIVLVPGDVFSFNLATGPRSKENGYRRAPVIMGGGFVDDYGGGVCQVSTTIYVAMLKASLSVEERHCHGIPVAYVPMGMDATVDFGSLDLKMKNGGVTPFITLVKADKGTLTARIFGCDMGGTRIELETSILKEYPAQVTSSIDPEGPAAPPKLRSGYLVETRRKYYSGDDLVRVERLGTSMYPPEKPPATQKSSSTN